MSLPFCFPTFEYLLYFRKYQGSKIFVISWIGQGDSRRGFTLFSIIDTNYRSNSWLLSH